jgi:glutamate dehydrogenase (NAD(P)+)
MPLVNFDEVSKLIDLPDDARELLGKPERELRITLSVRLDSELVQADVFVVYYCTARGPAKGGIRFWPTVSMQHTADLAENMVWKTALVGVPFGGGKSGIKLDPSNLSRMQKTAVLKEYVHILRPDLLSGMYVPAPDMGTSGADMAIIFGETHISESVTGKPPRVGGLPGRLEATGRGVSTSVLEGAKRYLGSELSGKTVAVQGFGNVGSWTARFLAGYGARVVALSDISGGVYADHGLDVIKLAEWVASGKLLNDYPEYDKLSNEELIASKVDVLVPAATENVLTADNAASVQARLIVEGANGPTESGADAILQDKGVTIIPDILANSGGVIASYVEWRQAKSGSLTCREETFKTVDQLVLAALDRVDRFAASKKVTLRDAARALSVEEVVSTMQDRCWI